MFLDKEFALLDVVGALVVVLDAEGRIARWNAACSQLTGFSVDEVRGRCLWDLFSCPGDIPQETLPSAKLRAGQLPRQFENRWVTRGGERRWFAWSTTAVTADGEIEFLLATGVDVTEHKRAEEELRRSEERFRLLVSGVGEHAIFSLDPEGRVTSWNVGAERIYGFRAGEVLGKHVSIFRSGGRRRARVGGSLASFGQPRSNPIRRVARSQRRLPFLGEHHRNRVARRAERDASRFQRDRARRHGPKNGGGRAS